MKELFKRYENVILLLALFILASVLLANNVKGKAAANPLERFALTIASPLQKFVMFSYRTVSDAWFGYIYLVNTNRENVQLKKQLEKERFKSGLLLEDLKKYRRVDNLLSYHPIARSGFQVAEVIAWDSTNIAQTLVINKGQLDNVHENMVAFTHEGLVGRVVTAAGHSSRVLMITDARSAVDAYVQNSRARCIVVGQNRKQSIVRYLSRDAEVKPGDTLISSGLGGIFPKGLPLGRISSLEPGEGMLFYRAEMKPAFNLDKIEEVLIMTGTSNGLEKGVKK
jgi:rod shape-determining protein MreC